MITSPWSVTCAVCPLIIYTSIDFSRAHFLETSPRELIEEKAVTFTQRECHNLSYTQLRSLNQKKKKNFFGALPTQHRVWLLIEKPLNLHHWKENIHQSTKQTGKQKWWHSLFLLFYLLSRSTLTQSFKQVVQSDKKWSGLHSQGRIWETLNLDDMLSL